MGGKDANPALSRASRDGSTSSSFHAASRSSAAAPFYRQFLPAQLSNISANDSIPSLDELSALAKHLGRIKTESAARLSRLEGRSADPLRPIFFSAPSDLFSPPGLPPAPLNLYSDSPRQTAPNSSFSSISKQQKSRERSLNAASPAPSGSNSALNGSVNPKIKIKRERDNDSAPASSSALYSDARSPQKLGSAGGKANPRSKAARGHSFDVGGDDESIASTDPEWDLDEDSMPSSQVGRMQSKRSANVRMPMLIRTMMNLAPSLKLVHCLAHQVARQEQHRRPSMLVHSQQEAQQEQQQQRLPEDPKWARHPWALQRPRSHQ